MHQYGNISHLITATMWKFPHHTG